MTSGQHHKSDTALAIRFLAIKAGIFIAIPLMAAVVTVLIMLG